jgi:hypothetical protein
MVPPTARYLAHGRQRIAAKISRGIGIRRITDINQPVWRQGELLRGRLGGANIHTAINHRGVHTDDFTGQRTAELNGKIGLARRSRPHQKDRWRQ